MLSRIFGGSDDEAASEPIELQDGARWYDINGLEMDGEFEYQVEFEVPDEMTSEFEVEEVRTVIGEVFIDGEGLSGATATVLEC